MTLPSARRLKVFLCHASEDKPIVRQLYERLRQDGFDPWLDSEVLLPGQDWDLEIRKAMRQSDVVIVCLSNATLTKEGYVQKEISYAQEIQKEKPEGAIFLIPLQLEACQVPFSLSHIQWGRLFDPDGYQKLVESLNRRAAQLQVAQGARREDSVPLTAPPQGAGFVIASGSEAVAFGGDVRDCIIVTGDQNLISLGRKGKLVFEWLSDDFRQRQRSAPRADFYDAQEPNWANIANGDDAPRRLLDELLAFARRSELPYRAALILGAAGEGKTTLLRRLAWELAEEGAPVLVRHEEYLAPAFRLPISPDRPLVLVIDEAADEEEIPKLAKDLRDHGVPFLMLLAARQHEWQNANLEAALKRAVTLGKFLLRRLERSEVEAILDRLERAARLDALKGLPRAQQVEHFLDRLKADGQLLPAMLTARYGTEFEDILLRVFEKLRRRMPAESEFLLDAYALLASVHRFGFWLGRDTLAGALGIPQDRVYPRVLAPLEGELIEIREQGEDRLITRHPVIAERALRLLEERHWVSPAEELYRRIFEALGEVLRREPQTPQRKLLTLLPLRFLARADYQQARWLFERARLADPTNAAVYQAWALMEAKLGRYEEARRLFELGVRADPTDAPSSQAWALMELKLDAKRALEVVQRGLEKVTDPSERARLLSTQGSAWAKLGKFREADQAFEASLRLSPSPYTHYYFALRSLWPQGQRSKACEHYRRALALNPPPDLRRKIEKALKRCPKN